MLQCNDKRSIRAIESFFSKVSWILVKGQRPSGGDTINVVNYIMVITPLRPIVQRPQPPVAPQPQRSTILNQILGYHQHNNNNHIPSPRTLFKIKIQLINHHNNNFTILGTTHIFLSILIRELTPQISFSTRNFPTILGCSEYNIESSFSDIGKHLTRSHTRRRPQPCGAVIVAFVLQIWRSTFAQVTCLRPSVVSTQKKPVHPSFYA
ncbi:unnamed protein product [Citrullus colocynthis]|uniref:Uncharacterized protein n=1 Tax=Citrullus colocynthis TaxID=252529 RepID=A0ABP0YXD2_9ROSI